mmetsp:Transcript_25235/g.38742  ORF Transcript_25235/g.38742 Transcript_25235/m.38742 type:complete len:120 (+) Transcript_25235:334-693(+)
MHSIYFLLLRALHTEFRVANIAPMHSIYPLLRRALRTACLIAAIAIAFYANMTTIGAPFLATLMTFVREAVIANYVGTTWASTKSMRYAIHTQKVLTGLALNHRRALCTVVPFARVAEV